MADEQTGKNEREKAQIYLKLANALVEERVNLGDAVEIYAGALLDCVIELHGGNRSAAAAHLTRIGFKLSTQARHAPLTRQGVVVEDKPSIELPAGALTQ
jgi:hypothetical protein